MGPENFRIKKCVVITLMFLSLSFSGCGDRSHADIHYTAIGASDAVGVGASPVTNGYVYRIDEGLDNSGQDTALLNLGIPGAEIREIKNIELPLLLEGDPDLVTIFTGGNDLVGGVSVEDFETDLGTLLSTIREDTSAFIVIATLPDITKAERFVEEPDGDVTLLRLNSFNSAIVRQAANYRASVVDLRNFDVGANVTAEDGYHPNNEGHQILADEFLKVIRPHAF